MAWRIVQQPNGLFARFSEIVDDFTDYNMTREEAIDMCISEHDYSYDEAERKVQRGVDAGIARFYEAIAIVRRMHGDEGANEEEKEMSKEE